MSTTDSTTSGDALVLQPPTPVDVVAPAKAENAVPLAPAETTKLDGQVAQFVEAVTSLDLHGPDFKSRVDAISAMGNAEVMQSASMSNRMLERPVNALKNGMLDEKSPITKNLIDLRETIEKLDPSRQGDLFAPRKLLGLIPLGSKPYFDGYRSAQAHLNAIIEALYRSKDELQKDNAAVETEKARVSNRLKRLVDFGFRGFGATIGRHGADARSHLVDGSWSTYARAAGAKRHRTAGSRNGTNHSAPSHSSVSHTSD